MEDSPVPRASFDHITVPEGNSGTTDVHLKITLSGAFKYEQAVFFEAAGTATFGSDYDGPATVFLAPGQTSADVIVRIHGDTLPEPDETILLTAYASGIGPDWSGVIIILNDDYILTPDSMQIARGTVGSASVTTSVPSPTNDHVVLSSSNPNVATVSPFIDVPAGSLGRAFDVTAVSVGSAVITATLPLSRGGATTTTLVDVYSSTFFYFEKPAVSLPLSQTTTATMHFEPPPTEPLPLFLAQTNPSVAGIPPFFTVGTNGIGTFTVHGTGVGNTALERFVSASDRFVSASDRFVKRPRALR